MLGLQLSWSVFLPTDQHEAGCFRSLLESHRGISKGRGERRSPVVFHTSAYKKDTNQNDSDEDHESDDGSPGVFYKIICHDYNDFFQ